MENAARAEQEVLAAQRRAQREEAEEMKRKSTDMNGKQI